MSWHYNHILYLNTMHPLLCGKNNSSPHSLIVHYENKQQWSICQHCWNGWACLFNMIVQGWHFHWDFIQKSLGKELFPPPTLSFRHSFSIRWLTADTSEFLLGFWRSKSHDLVYKVRKPSSGILHYFYLKTWHEALALKVCLSDLLTHIVSVMFLNIIVSMISSKDFFCYMDLYVYQSLYVA